MLFCSRLRWPDALLNTLLATDKPLFLENGPASVFATMRRNKQIAPSLFRAALARVMRISYRASIRTTYTPYVVVPWTQDPGMQGLVGRGLAALLPLPKTPCLPSCTQKEKHSPSMRRTTSHLTGGKGNRVVPRKLPEIKLCPRWTGQAWPANASHIYVAEPNLEKLRPCCLLVPLNLASTFTER